MNQHAMRDIVELTFWETDTVTGKEFPAFVIDSLKSANVEGAAEATDLRGGRGNGLYTIFESQRDITITCTDALLVPELFAARMGTELKKFSATEKGTIKKVKTANIAQQDAPGVSTVQLDDAPKDASKAIVYVTVAGERKQLTHSVTTVVAGDAGEFSYDAATKKIEIPNDDLDGAALIQVFFETEITKGEQIVISDDKFANKTYRVTGDYFTRIVSGAQEVEAPAQLEIPRAKFDSAFALAFAPDGDPQTFEFKLRALKRPGSKELMKITMY